MDEIKKDNHLHCSQNYCCKDIFVLLHWHANFQIEASFTIHIVIASINNLNQSLNQTAIKSLTCARKFWNYITYKFLFKSVIVQIGPKSLWYTVDKIRKGCHLDCGQNKSCLNALAPLHWHANLWNEITYASLNNLKPKMALTDNLSQNYPTFFSPNQIWIRHRRKFSPAPCYLSEPAITDITLFASPSQPA